MLMVAGGIGGGMIGRNLRRVDDRMVERMFLILMAVIIGISLFNSIWTIMMVGIISCANKKDKVCRSLVE